MFGLKDATSRAELSALYLLLLASIALFVVAATLPAHASGARSASNRAGQAVSAVKAHFTFGAVFTGSVN